MITKYNNFFSKEICDELDSLIDVITSKHSRNIPMYSTSIHNWSPELVSHSTPILRYSFTEENNELIGKIKKEILDKTTYEIDNLVIHFFPKLSYITWHDDGDYKGALTIYLNKKWDYNWGGYFLYQEENEIKAILPDYNLGVLQENGVPHCVSTINVNSDIRISIQAFLRRNKKLV